jgi:ribonuclease HII
VIEPDLAIELELASRLPPGGLIIGMDEVGRGALAGPVAVGAVAIIPSQVVVPKGLRDSKLLTEPRREALQPVVAEWGTARAVGLASAKEVDEFGIVAALARAAARALVELQSAGIEPRSVIVLLDGSHDWLTPAMRPAPMVVTRVKADRDCASVAAASVLAKVHRDRLMAASDIVYPGFSWSGNKGYGAPSHLEALRVSGPSPLHRHSFLTRIELPAPGGVLAEST